jgi:hypothetical protein
MKKNDLDEKVSFCHAAKVSFKNDAIGKLSNDIHDTSDLFQTHLVLKGPTMK